MKLNAALHVLSVMGIWSFQNFAQAVSQHTTDNSFVCDYTHLESQLETLKTAHEFLKLNMEMLKHQLGKQKDVLNNVERKLNDLPKQLQTIQDKIRQDNIINFEELKDFLQNQIQNQNQPATLKTDDDKFFLLADIKDMLQEQETMLVNITENIGILEKVEAKLLNIESASMTKTEQLKLYRDVQRYFSKNDASKICFKGDNHDLLCTSQTYPTSCADFVESHCADNKCRISNPVYGPGSFLVSCNDHEEGGGWTVIQRRINGSVYFYRNWSEYKNGFGSIEGEFFIGLDKLNALTTTLKPVELLIQLEDFNNTLKYAKYDDFQVGNETENYKLIKVGSYAGNAGDALSSHEGNSFSTKDRDNDLDEEANCAIDKTGAWWYKSCMWSNLNGKYYANGASLPSGVRGICWSEFHGYNYSLKSVQMMIRPKKL